MGEVVKESENEEEKGEIKEEVVPPVSFLYEVNDEAELGELFVSEEDDVEESNEEEGNLRKRRGLLKMKG